MARPPTSDLDIFEDDDLARSQDLLRAETPPPKPASLAVETTRAKASEPESDEPGGSEPEPISAEVRFRVRGSMRARLDEFKIDLGRTLGGVRLTDSIIGRALLDWMLEEVAPAAIERAQEARGTLRMPASGNSSGLKKLEEGLKAILGSTPANTE